ncbi:MAG: hypothetical protein UMR38_08270 [Candidatus Izemoplasma sp.]|nr:hypothetical protein [Candidatus Izemoplasma sp.]
MNLVKIMLVLFTGAGFGFGIDQINHTETDPINEETRSIYEEESYCHRFSDESFLDHMLEGLTEEEQTLVNAKIDELLVSYDTTLEALYDDFELRHDFMFDLMTYLEDNNIDYHYGESYHDRYNDDDWHHHRRMR